MNRKTIAALALFVLFTWGGAAGIAFGITQGAEGPRGEQGVPGEKGERGSAGQEPQADFGLEEGLRTLATMYATDHLLDTGDYGSSLKFSHPQVQACVDFIMDYKGSLTDCGFQRGE